MLGLSIHLEGDKYVVRVMTRSTKENDEYEAAQLALDPKDRSPWEGKKVGGGYATRVAAAASIHELEVEAKKEAAIGAAKELLAR